MKLAARACVVCGVVAGLLATALAAEEEKTPAQWVAQLGADNLADRDAATTALLGLGLKAREDVKLALDSKDPEVRSRAKELWKTLRWQVIPGAEEDVQKMAEDAVQDKLDEARWRDFVKNHGVGSLHLAAEFQAGGLPAKTYQACLPTLLEGTAPLNVARVISHPERPGEQEAFDALLDLVHPADVSSKTAQSWMQVQIALWRYDKAFEFGREFSFAHGGDELAKTCAVAVDRGQMVDKTVEEARKEITAETDPSRLCIKLGFYTGLLSNFEKRKEMDELCEAAEKVKTSEASDDALRGVVEVLLKLNMPVHAVKILHNVHTPLALYMRSSADVKLPDTVVAGTDWREALATIDAVDPSKKKETIYDLAELMHDWHDQRAEFLWQKILTMAPVNTPYDANACFRLGEALEERRDYTHAADFYEKGMNIAASTSGVLIATRSDGSGASAGTDYVREKIKSLRSQAAREATNFNGQSSGGDK